MSKYVITVGHNGETIITGTEAGELHQITNEHANFERILAAVTKDVSFAEFLNLLAGVEIDPRVEVRDGTVFFGNEPVHNSLTSTILRYKREGRDTTGLVKFLERLNANPSKRSRDQLFNWTQAKDLTIDPEGYFIGFKSVYSNSFEDDNGQKTYRSVSSGTALVNGEVRSGQIVQTLGDVVTMPRDQVQDDPTVGCHTGLHVGTWDYARTFSGDTVLEVKVDPADVVSVPTDSGFAKLRTCRYEIVGVHEIERAGNISSYEPEGDAQDEDAVEAIEDVLPTVPKTLLQRLRDRLSGRSHEVDEDADF